MTVAFDIPDEILSALPLQGKDLSRAALEAFALEGYRSRTFSTEQVRRMLGYDTRFEVWDLLAKHNVDWQYDHDDLAHDIAMSDQYNVHSG